MAYFKALFGFSLTVVFLNLNIFQWNAQSLLPKLTSFENLLVQEKIHIASVCETWLDNEKHIKIKDYITYRCDRDDSYGGVAVFVHKSVRSQRCTIQMSNTGLQVVHLKLFNCVDVENIVSIYCPPPSPSLHTTAQDWECFSIATSKCLVLGDFNGHHTNWSVKTDPRGMQIFDTLLETQLVTLNDCNPTRVKLRNGRLVESSPDIFMATSDIALKCNYKVLYETLGSDHRFMKVSINIAPSRLPTIKRNFKNADWISYTTTLQKLFENFIFSDNLQNDYNKFIDYVNISAELFIPYIRCNLNPCSKFSPKPYWNPSLAKLVAERRLALSQFRRNPIPRNSDILKDKINIAQNSLRKAKSDNFKNFCNSLDHTTSTSELWHKMKWVKGYNSSTNYVDEQLATGLLQSLSPDYASPKCPTFSSPNDLIGSDISLAELENSIPTKNTCPGTDNITYAMIKNLPNKAKCVLILV